MYIVEIKNGDEVKKIHCADRKLTSGKVVKGINAIDSFTFTIPPLNVGFNELHDFTTIVTVYNTSKKRYEFFGRVLYSDVSMDESGFIEKNVTCESYFGFLCDTVQPYVTERNWTVRELFEYIINQHNAQIEEYKRFTIGEITVTDPNDNLYVGIQRENTWETLSKKLIETLGGEIRFRVVDGVNYIDYLTQIGEVKTTPIKMSRNMKAISKETDPTAFVTKLIPLGAKLNDDTEERLGIETVNNSHNYLLDEEAVEKYGIHVGYIEFDDVTDANNLLRKAKAWFTENNRVKIKYSITALDLSLLGLDIDDFDVYNYYPIANPLLGIDDAARVIKKNIDICDDLKSNIEIGERFYTLSELQNKKSKTDSNTKTGQDKRLSEIENRVKKLESGEGVGTQELTEYVYNLKVGESFEVSYDKNSPSVECPQNLTYYDDGGLLVFTGAKAGVGTVYLYDSDTLIGRYIVRVIDPQIKVYDFTVPVGESFDIPYEGNSPSVECPSCLTYYDDGGLLVFFGAKVGKGTIYINDSDTLIGEYRVKVEEAIVYDYDLKIGDEFSIDYEGSSPSIECPNCLTYYDDGGLFVFTAAATGTGTIYLHNSDTLIGKYNVRVVAIGSGDDQNGGTAIVQQFANGLWIGNSVAKGSEDNFEGKEGAAGFFLDAENMAVKIVNGTEMTNVYLGEAIAKFA